MNSTLQSTLLTWVDSRLDEMLAAPRMWGSREAVEMQVLLLLELRTFLRHPSFATDDPRRVLDAYLAFLSTRFPKVPSSPLHELTAERPEIEFVKVLQEFRRLISSAILDENPFEHSDLAIELTFAQGRSPNATAVTGYYEEFRRATRAIIGAGKRRPTKQVEQATDFALEDVRVTPKNGVPAAALLRLGTPYGQPDFEAQAQVREGLTGLITLAEWAGSQEDVSALSVDDVEVRTRVAVQALRIVPRRGIQQVSIGGKLVGRPKPIRLEPQQEQRFIQVVGAGTSPEDFEHEDEVRAIDLDRGTLRLGKKPGIVCYVQREHLVNLAEVGIQARVRGKRYRPVTGAPFVIVDELESRSSEE